MLRWNGWSSTTRNVRSRGVILSLPDCILHAFELRLECVEARLRKVDIAGAAGMLDARTGRGERTRPHDLRGASHSVSGGAHRRCIPPARRIAQRVRVGCHRAGEILEDVALRPHVTTGDFGEYR